MKKVKLSLGLFVAVLLIVSAAGTLWAGDKININTASIKELSQLDNIGPSKAKKIMEYREKNGPFKKLEDIKKVKGIGTKTFALNKEHITLEDEDKASKTKGSSESEKTSADKKEDTRQDEDKASKTKGSSESEKTSADKKEDTRLSEAETAKADKSGAASEEKGSPEKKGAPEK
ncbi:helix-hairpin-helix domain-containing protein [Desulfobacterales bacterium HSG2]|nr:helix-hairpin-helix domain-containing protein [Desulfobacterales bacterium HSG2]